jgi:hypothetical protein
LKKKLALHLVAAFQKIVKQSVDARIERRQIAHLLRLFRSLKPERCAEKARRTALLLKGIMVERTG